MERHLQTVKKSFLVAGLSLIFAFQLFAQTPSVVRNIRLPLWAELDAYPGLVPVDLRIKMKIETGVNLIFQ